MYAIGISVRTPSPVPPPHSMDSPARVGTKSHENVDREEHYNPLAINKVLFPSSLPILPHSLTQTRTDAPSAPHKRFPPSNSPRREDHALCQRGDGALSSPSLNVALDRSFHCEKVVSSRQDLARGVHTEGQSVRRSCSLAERLPITHLDLQQSASSTTTSARRSPKRSPRRERPSQHHGSDPILRSPRTEARALSPSRRPGAHSRTSPRHGAMRSSSSPPRTSIMFSCGLDKALERHGQDSRDIQEVKGVTEAIARRKGSASRFQRECMMWVVHTTCSESILDRR